MFNLLKRHSPNAPHTAHRTSICICRQKYTLILFMHFDIFFRIQTASYAHDAIKSINATRQIRQTDFIHKAWPNWIYSKHIDNRASRSQCGTSVCHCHCHCRFRIKYMTVWHVSIKFVRMLCECVCVLHKHITRAVTTNAREKNITTIIERALRFNRAIVIFQYRSIKSILLMKLTIPMIVPNVLKRF